MYWLRRPPYARWILAALVVCSGLYLDLRPTAVATYPFAARTVASGEPIASQIEWRKIPKGVLPEWHGEVTGFAATEIAAGTPLVPSLATDIEIPEDWWAVSLPLPYAVAPGRRVRIAIDSAIVEGVLVGDITDTGFQLRGSVAFPAAAAALVASAAAADDALVVMIGSGDHGLASTG